MEEIMKKFLRFFKLLVISLTISAIGVMPMAAMEAPDSHQEAHIQWPILNSLSKPIHKVIIKSLLSKSKCKFKGYWFTAKLDQSRNEELFAYSDQIKGALGEGLLVEIKPTSSEEVYSQFTNKCAYKVSIEDTEIATFILRTIEPEANFERTQVRQRASTSDAVRHHENIVHIGHGTFGPNVDGALSHEKISAFIAQTRGNPILDLGYAIIEAADLANIQDPILLAKYVKHHRNGSIDANSVIQAIKQDLVRFEKVSQRLDQLHVSTGGFRDQIKRLTKHQVLKRTIAFIIQYPEICTGTIADITTYHGGDMVVLRAALFYTALMQQGCCESFQALAQNLSGFYRTSSYDDRLIEQLLSQTHLFVDGVFYAPANSYVLYADNATLVNQVIDDLPLTFEPHRTTRNLPMCFGDCTGFVSQIVRQLREDIPWLACHRFKSRDLEIVHDVMIKEQRVSYRYVGVGRSRPLTRQEIDRITHEFSGSAKLAALTKAFIPISDRDALKAGDVIVFRQRPNGLYSTKTGHAVIVVDPRPSRDPNLITVIECTRASDAGLKHGYGWRTVQLNRGGTWETRVLRINQNN